MAPNYDNRYNSVEPRQTFSPSFKKANVDIVSEQEIYEPMKNSTQLKNKRSIKLASNKASIISGPNIDYVEHAPVSPEIYLKAARKSVNSPKRNGNNHIVKSAKK